MLKIVLTAVFSFFLVTSQAADDMPLPGDAPPVMARGAKGKAKPTPAPHTAAPHAAKKATARPRHVARSSSKAKRVHAQPSKHLKSSKRSRITTRGHAEGGGKGGARVACSIAVVFTLGAEEEAVQTVMLADGVDAVPAASKHLMNVALMGDIKDEAILRGVENPVQGDAELHDSKIRAQMAAGLAECLDECLTDFLRKFGQFLQRQGFEVGRGVDGRQLGVHRSKKVEFRHLQPRRICGGGLGRGVCRCLRRSRRYQRHRQMN